MGCRSLGGAWNLPDRSAHRRLTAASIRPLNAIAARSPDRVNQAASTRALKSSAQLDGHVRLKIVRKWVELTFDTLAIHLLVVRMEVHTHNRILENNSWAFENRAAAVRP